MRKKRERIISTHIIFRGVEYKSKYEGKFAELLYTLGIPYVYEPFDVLLINGFRYNRKAIRPTYYTPDFGLPNNVVLEAKGFETPEWKIKRKLLFQRLNDADDDLNFTFYEIHENEKKFMKEFMAFINAEYPHITEETVKQKYNEIIKGHKLAGRRRRVQSRP